MKVSFPEHTFIRCELSLEIEDLSTWVASQTLYPKVYWEGREKRAALGKIYSVDEVPVFHSAATPSFFGAIDFFQKRKTALWKEFPKQHFFIPLLELYEKDQKITCFVNCQNEEGAVERVRALLQPEKKSLPSFPQFHSRSDTPSLPEWKQSIQTHLQAIEKGSYQKIVCARKTELTFKEPLSPFHLMSHLRHPSSTLFCYQLSPHLTFMGASPELFYRRSGLLFETMALAGTRPKPPSLEEETALQKELLTDKKEQREFEYVHHFMQKKLSLLCTQLDTSSLHILKTSRTQHLIRTYRGILSQNYRDKDLIETLHPTPAMGGFPENALSQLYALESFDRGYYGSPLGWIGPDAAELIVAIRSALIVKNKMHLFAGTGIVKGSDDLKEWQELEHKISQYI